MDPRTLLAPVALALGDVLTDLDQAERALFRVCAEERRRADANFSDAELNTLFAAWHALKAVTASLRARDPWKEKQL